MGDGLELATRIAGELEQRAGELGQRWRAQARAVAPRGPGQRALADADESAQLIGIVAEALRGAPQWQERLVQLGWALGAAAHAGGMSLHAMLKEMDLLEAMALYACERLLEQRDARASAADGIRLARMLHRVFSLLGLATAKGFTTGYLDALRHHYRVLRHDLRNPLGTIQSAVAMMADETMPADLRSADRYQSLLSRNANVLDVAIGSALDDASALGSELARQEVSLREVALSVRRDLREELAESGCELIVAPGLPDVVTDGAAFELLLKMALGALLAAVPDKSTLTIGVGHVGDRAVAAAIRYPAGLGTTRLSRDSGIAAARELARRAGGRLVVEPERMLIEVPISPRQPRDDLRSAGER